VFGLFNLEGIEMSEGMYIDVCQVKTYMAIDELKVHPDNSELRKITPEQLSSLKDSITCKGFYEPILVWNEQNIVLSGNQRLKAAVELVNDGWVIGAKRRPNKLPVVIIDVDDKTAKEILIGSNTHHGDWIEETLASALKEFENPLRLGFSQLEIDRLVDISEEDIEKEILEASKDLDGASEAPLPPKDREDLPEPLDSLTLPQSAMKDLKGILKSIAKCLNDDWATKDSYEYATNVLCQAIRESGFIDDIKKGLEKDES